MFAHRTKMEIFNSIIEFIMIKVMNLLFRIKRTTQKILHYKTMFVNITILLSKGIIGHVNKLISSSTNFPSPFPESTIFTRDALFITGSRTIYSFAIGRRLKGLETYLAFRHGISVS